MRPTRRSTKRKNGGATAYSGPRHCPMNNGECERRLVLLGPARHKITNTDAIARNSALTLAEEQATLTAHAARGTPRERLGASSRHGHSMTQAREIRASRITHTHWLLLGMLLVASGLLLSIRSGDAVATRGPLPADERFPSWSDTLPLAIPAADEHGARLPATEPSVSEKAAEQWRTNKVRSGDTLSSNHAAGVITSSLFEAVQQAGMSEALTMQPAGIFGWDIDFALDLRDGDRFAVVYDDLYVDGDHLRHGDILAAQFVNRGRTYQAVRYTDASGRSEYYTADGRSMRKAFLRPPVEFSRISSGFSTGRLPPVLNQIRAHKGVDYAAHTGTPIKATVDGKIAFVGVKSGYGNDIELQHGSRYSPLYGHMSRFASAIRPGSRIRQGQTIGYVGMTGLATGPHLHYEFRIDGAHRNPLTVQLPEAAPIAPAYRKDFLAKTQALLSQLEQKKNPQLAANES